MSQFRPDFAHFDGCPLHNDTERVDLKLLEIAILTLLGLQQPIFAQ